MTLGPYSKFILSALATLLAGITPGLLPGGEPLGLSGIVNVIVLGLGALQVLNAPNVAWWGYAKGIAAGITAAGVILVSALSDGGVNSTEATQIVLALVVNLGGVVVVRNSGSATRDPNC